jgi:HPt (histidine-containing phosphotransfer) domain-containing protein
VYWHWKILFEGGIMAIGIPGVDENIYNDLLDGNEELFTTVLGIFVEKTPDTLAKLANPTKETLADYAITVHGLKGACANICAEELREKAFKLEQLSRAGDLNSVLAENAPFLMDVQDMVERGKKWLKARK